MIKVLFISDDYSEIDLEQELEISKDVDEWLELNIPEISFDCMDYPSDATYNYVCYFQSTNELYVCSKLYKLLEGRIKPFSHLQIEISVVNNCLEDEQVIHTGIRI